MKKIFLIIVGVVMFLARAEKINAQQIATDAIAIVLKVNGQEEKISGVSLYSFKKYQGRVKPEQYFSAENMLHVVITDSQKRIVFDGTFDNPLTRILESFSSDGKIERVHSPKQEDYINIRFALHGSEEKLSITCYQVMKEKNERLISTFELSLK